MDFALCAAASTSTHSAPTSICWRAGWRAIPSISLTCRFTALSTDAIDDPDYAIGPSYFMDTELTERSCGRVSGALCPTWPNITSTSDRTWTGGAGIATWYVTSAKQMLATETVTLTLREYETLRTAALSPEQVQAIARHLAPTRRLADLERRGRATGRLLRWRYCFRWAGDRHRAEGAAGQPLLHADLCLRSPPVP